MWKKKFSLALAPIICKNQGSKKSCFFVWITGIRAKQKSHYFTHQLILPMKTGKKCVLKAKLIILRLSSWRLFKSLKLTYVHSWTLEAARFCPLFFPLVRFDCRMARFPTQIKEVTGGHDHLFISKLEVWQWQEWMGHYLECLYRRRESFQNLKLVVRSRQAF